MARSSPIVQFFLSHAVFWEAGRMRKRFHRALDRAKRTQERVLMAKLRRNADSDFGRRHGFARIRSVDDFRRALPVSTYADAEPHIQRVRDGDFAALFGRRQKLHMFAMTSGTSSRPKYIPVTGAFLDEYRRGWMTWGVHAFVDHPRAFNTGVLQLVSAMDDETAPCGLPCGAISGLTAGVQRRAVHNTYVVPPEASQLKDAGVKYHVALLLALQRRRLIAVSANPSTLLGLARTMNDRADDLLRDLRDGRLSPRIDVPAAVRAAIDRRLDGAPARCRELEALRLRHGALRPCDVWEMPFIGCWKGGTLSLYLREFPQYYGATPVRDIGLVASEGRMTVPLADEGSSGVLDVESQFFEFLPARDGERTGDDPVLPHELASGGEYFLVLTNSAGLYRYDIGDLVRVVGFRDASPLVEFLNKGVHSSSLTGEKLTEHQVVEAVNRALAETDVALSSYCVAPRWTEGAMPRYLILVQANDAADREGTASLAGRVEQLLRETNMEYNGKRDSGRLAPLGVKIVPGGAWQRFDMETIAERRRGIEQYKHKFLVGDVEFEKRFEAVAELL